MNLVIAKTEDEERLLEIFHSNVPKYFDVSEVAPFVEFLKKELTTYFVCLDKDHIVGAGGYMELELGEARICWIMVEAKLHGKGVGRFMMQEFAQKIRADKNYTRITLKTTQFTDKFYEKLGYKTTYFEKDFWIPGWHLYFMEQAV